MKMNILLLYALISFAFVISSISCLEMTKSKAKLRKDYPMSNN